MIDVDKALSVENHFRKYDNVRSVLISGTELHNAVVSICIPTYNRVETLKQTIDSCLSQVGVDDFIIIVSDNNPERDDATEKYIRTLSSSRILHYKHEQNIGMFGNINRAFELSKSEYTVIIHDDDVLFPHFLKICLDVMIRQKSIEVLFPDKQIWLSDLSPLPGEMLPKRALLYKATQWDFIADNPCPPTGMIARTASIRRIGGFDYDTYPSNDYYFNIKALRNIGVYRLACGLYAYRMGANATTKKETIVGFMKVDPPLIRWILSREKLLGIFQSYFMLDYSYYWINYYKTNHPEEKLENLDKDVVTSFRDRDLKKLRIFKRLFRYAKIIRHHLSGKRIRVSLERV